MAKHSEKYEFPEPMAVKECLDRMETLYRDVENIHKQLGDRTKRSHPDYDNWREKTKAAAVYKRLEYAFLKRWLKEYRWSVEANEAGVFDVRDPRTLLLRAMHAMRAVPKEHRPKELGPVLAAIEGYLLHDGTPSAG